MRRENLVEEALHNSRVTRSHAIQNISLGFIEDEVTHINLGLFTGLRVVKQIDLIAPNTHKIPCLAVDILTSDPSKSVIEMIHIRDRR